MVQFSSTQPFQTLAIPLHKFSIALFLIILEAERVGPVSLPLLLDLFVSELQRAVDLEGREELWVHFLILHTVEPMNLHNIQHQIINNLGGSAHLGCWYLLGWYATEKLRV